MANRKNAILTTTVNGTVQAIEDPALRTLAAVAATASTSTTPFGYAQAQADAIVTQLNLIITLLKERGESL